MQGQVWLFRVVPPGHRMLLYVPPLRAVSKSWYFLVALVPALAVSTWSGTWLLPQPKAGAGVSMLCSDSKSVTSEECLFLDRVVC